MKQTTDEDIKKLLVWECTRLNIKASKCLCDMLRSRPPWHPGSSRILALSDDELPLHVPLPCIGCPGVGKSNTPDSSTVGKSNTKPTSGV